VGDCHRRELQAQVLVVGEAGAHVRERVRTLQVQPMRAAREDGGWHLCGAERLLAFAVDKIGEREPLSSLRRLEELGPLLGKVGVKAT